MKKLKLLVMPLMVIPFLASCNNSGGGGGDTPDDPIPLEECTWEQIDEISKAGKASKWFKVGDTKTIKVNNQDHQVRIIGFNQDKDKDGNEIGITFEFVNLISDEHGHSLATQWNDTNDVAMDTGSANYNYLDSSVRMALVGEHEQDGHILWAQKEATAWSSDSSYQKKCVLDMIERDNPGFKDTLKSPSKYVNIYNTTGIKWEEKTINDKLFLLSPFEMGKTTHIDEEGRTTTYSYYEGAEDADRIKKQVKSEETYSPDPKPEINYVSSSGQVYQGKVTNCAGYNDNATESEYGGIYWLRSPITTSKCNAWKINTKGQFVEYDNVCAYANAIAPAFCI